MNSRSLSTIAVVAFLLLGGLLMGLRWYRIQRLERAREEQRWELVYTAAFDAELAVATEEAVLRFGLPSNTRYCRVLNLDEEPWTVSSPAIERRRVVLPMSGTNVLRLTTRQSGQRYNMSASFKLLISPRAETSRPALENLTLDQRQVFLKPEPSSSSSEYADALRSVLEQLPDTAETDAQQVQWAFQFCSGIDSSGDSASDAVDVALKNGKGTPKARARAMVAICREMKIPARLVAGFRVQQGADVQPQVWVEVFLEQAWVPFDPTAGWSLILPMDYVPVWRDSDEVATATPNVSNFTKNFSIRRLEPNQSVLRTEIKHPIQIFNLTRLPFPMHRVMKILLLMPFAALITAIIRNMIGVQTFGTFSPALLAMSFIYADWKTGLMILIVVVTIGLFGRSFLERLRLLMVPRLSIILTMVILCVVFSVSALHYMLPTITAEAVLLPMVIMTMLIERFHVTVEEDGLMFAIKLSIGTLVVAVLCFLVLKWDQVGQWVLTYPEIHFFTIAAFILLGRYAGYRLTELWRFRDLVESNEAVR